MSSTLIICDIDGVLADCSHRLHYLEEKNYEAFYGITMAEDKLIEAGLALLRSMGNLFGYEICLLTGRPERTAAITRNWLIANRIGCRFTKMLMRHDSDHRPSPEVKVELLKNNIKKKELRGYDIIYFIDDDPENVKAVCKAFPKITGITFGIKRMEE